MEGCGRAWFSSASWALGLCDRETCPCPAQFCSLHLCPGREVQGGPALAQTSHLLSALCFAFVSSAVPDPCPSQSASLDLRPPFA